MKFNGGIEQYLYDLVKVLIEDNNIRIIWLLDRTREICNSFKDIFIDERLSIIDTKSSGMHWFKHDAISLNPDEENVILSFSPVNMAMALLIAQQYNHFKIKCLYCLPNTTGETYFIERFFNGFISQYIKKRMSWIHKKWVEHNAVRYFSYNHIGALESNYSLDIVDKEEKCLPVVTKMPIFPVETVLKKISSSTFNIITVSRFDFPHKGYLLGLIQSFGKIRESHKDVRLYIIGHGQHEEQVLNEISKLEKEAQENIFLLGQVEKNEISSYMANAHLNISVAGGVACGAICGVPSIPARNFCHVGCEVYGLLPNSYTKTTSTDPGDDVLPYIEYFLSLERDDYIKECYNSYNSYLNRYSNYNPFYFFEQSSSIALTNNKTDIRFIKWVSILYRLKNKLSK